MKWFLLVYRSEADTRPDAYKDSKVAALNIDGEPAVESIRRFDTHTALRDCERGIKKPVLRLKLNEDMTLEEIPYAI